MKNLERLTDKYIGAKVASPIALAKKHLGEKPECLSSAEWLEHLTAHAGRLRRDAIFDDPRCEFVPPVFDRASDSWVWP